MENKKEVKKRLDNESKVTLTTDADFTALSDAQLANAHLYDLYDKVSIQANVEMSRRLKKSVLELKETIVTLNKQNAKKQKQFLILTIIGIIITITQIFPVQDTVTFYIIEPLIYAYL